MKRFFGSNGSAVLWLALTLLGSPVQAATITWDEGTDGDLTPELTPFTLGAGVNTFSGTVSAFFPGQPNDLDSFLFDIAPGHMLVSASFAFSDVQHSATTTNLGVEYAVTSADVSSYFTPSQNITLYFPAGTAAVSPVALFELSLPLGTGSYRLLPGIGGADPGLEFSWAYDYTLSLSVVPLPPALALFIAPLFVAATIRRRGQR